MVEAAPSWAVAGARVYAEAGPRPGAVLTVSGSQISELGGRRPERAQTLDLPANWHVVPGFIDAHIHGAAGADVMDASGRALARLSRYLPREGTTSFLATTMTASRDRISAAAAALGAFAAPPGGAEMLGVHLEGPFIDPGKPGAQPPAWIIPPDIEAFTRWQALAEQRIKVVTLAPETPGASELMGVLRAHGVRASIGHSGCSAATARRALAGGCRRATHLFNAMAGLHHRDPGAACAVLADDDCVAEIIADGIHVAPEMLRLAYRVKSARGLIAITDAMRAKGLGDGVYELGGQRVTVSRGAARLDNGTLAGSVLRLDQALRNLIDACDCSLAEAIDMVSVNPARDLGVDARKGALSPGKDADFVVLDERLGIRLSVCRGRIAYDALR